MNRSLMLIAAATVAAGFAVTLKTTVPAAGCSVTPVPFGLGDAPVTPSVAAKATLHAPT